MDHEADEDAKLRNLTEPGKHFDGFGLYLDVTKAGGRYWRFEIPVRRQRKAAGAGCVSSRGAQGCTRASGRRAPCWPAVATLAAGRQGAGRGAANTFGVARDWHQHQAARWEPETGARILASLAADIFPTLGSPPHGQHQAGRGAQLILKIEKRGAVDQAGRVLRRVKAVYRWAVIHERIANPMLDLVLSEILKPREVQHRAAMADKELPSS